MTQRELGGRANVSPTTVRLLECGRRGAYPVTMKKLAEALDVPIAAFTLGHHPGQEEHASK